MKLQLKEELKGLSISINIFGIGLVTMDTNKISEDDYIKYHKLGFQDSFIEKKENDPIVLTEEDALADLNGTKRPDNHTVSYKNINQSDEKPKRTRKPSRK